ncbi:hypothetical protein Taro_055388 [Colocasia esculenta]|uniref:Protein BIC1 n=1 Tax=Colocasia esculenta TaxID=4460 RepID=A0A843XU34_COLES|nr:hypothetical protein [Colocasia esculenta]
MEDARELAGKDSVVVHALAEGAAGGGEQLGATGGVMLHLAGCFDRSDRQTASPVGHLPREERTHVKDLQGSPSPALPGVAPCSKGKLAESVSSQKEERHQGRPGFLEDGGGVLVAGEAAPEPPAGPEEGEEYCGRERLKRHRVAMAGQVWIPESWGQEKLLKDWIDCAAIDRSLVPTGLLSAREALVEECRRTNSGRFRLENQCLST